MRLDSLEVIGVEALSRFEGGPPTPDRWFHEAAAVGRGAELEVASIALATSSIPQLPGDIVPLGQCITGADREVGSSGDPRRDSRSDRVVLEITEHEQIDDYDELTEVLAPLRARGLRVAIDDAGARAIRASATSCMVKPEVIKLDISITRAIDRDPFRRALATALIGFATEIDADLVAEGVETSAELETLQHLGARVRPGLFLLTPCSVGGDVRGRVGRQAEDMARSVGLPSLRTCAHRSAPAGANVNH